jgi:hypothetical protein
MCNYTAACEIQKQPEKLIHNDFYNFLISTDQVQTKLALFIVPLLYLVLLHAKGTAHWSKVCAHISMKWSPNKTNSVAFSPQASYTD